VFPLSRLRERGTQGVRANRHHRTPLQNLPAPADNRTRTDVPDVRWDALGVDWDVPSVDWDVPGVDWDVPGVRRDVHGVDGNSLASVGMSVA
jgi:hypothetical protein